MCSHFGARVRRGHMLRETAHATQHVPQHFDCVRANGSLSAPLVALISFTSYGTDQRTQESELNRSINQLLLNFAWLDPTLGPKHNSRFRVFSSKICWSQWSVEFLKYLVERKSQYPCGMLLLHLSQKQAKIWGRCFSSIVGFRSPNLAQSETEKIYTLGFGRRNIGKWNFDHWEIKVQHSAEQMVSYTYNLKESILSPECLAYWSRWLEVLP